MQATETNKFDLILKYWKCWFVRPNIAM